MCLGSPDPSRRSLVPRFALRDQVGIPDHTSSNEGGPLVLGLDA